METIDPSSKVQTVTIATPRLSNVNTTFRLPAPSILQKVDILFAAGHVGLTGVRISYNGIALLPWNQPAGFIIGDSERLPFDVGMYLDGAMTIATHNGDTYPHTHILSFYYHEYQEVNRITPLPAVPLVVL